MDRPKHNNHDSYSACSSVVCSIAFCQSACVIRPYLTGHEIRKNCSRVANDLGWRADDGSPTVWELGDYFTVIERSSSLNTLQSIEYTTSQAKLAFVVQVDGWNSPCPSSPSPRSAAGVKCKRALELLVRLVDSAREVEEVLEVDGAFHKVCQLGYTCTKVRSSDMCLGIFQLQDRPIYASLNLILEKGFL